MQETRFEIRMSAMQREDIADTAQAMGHSTAELLRWAGTRQAMAHRLSEAHGRLSATAACLLLDAHDIAKTGALAVNDFESELELSHWFVQIRVANDRLRNGENQAKVVRNLVANQPVALKVTVARLTAEIAQ